VRLPRRCGNCGRWFLLEGGRYAGCGDKCRTDPVRLICNLAYKTHCASYLKKQMSAFSPFSAWRGKFEHGQRRADFIRPRCFFALLQSPDKAKPDRNSWQISFLSNRHLFGFFDEFRNFVHEAPFSCRTDLAIRPGASAKARIVC